MNKLEAVRERCAAKCDEHAAVACQLDNKYTRTALVLAAAAIRALPLDDLAQHTPDAGEEKPCDGCGGSGWVVRDPDIGTDQECFVCDGTGKSEAAPQPGDVVAGLVEALTGLKKVVELCVQEEDGTQYAYIESRRKTFVHIADALQLADAALAKVQEQP